MTYCLGYGTEVWTAYNYYFWMYVDPGRLSQKKWLTAEQPDGCSILRVFVRRLSLRCLHLHRPGESDQ